MQKLSYLRAVMTLIAAVFFINTQLFADESDTVPTDAPNAQKSEQVCFWANQIRTFRAIDNKHVYLQTSGKKGHFLATLFNSCRGIQFSESIGIASRPTARICSNGKDYLQAIDSGHFPQQCLISNIERVASRDAAKALVAKRKQEKENQKKEQTSSNTTKNVLAMK